MSLDSGIIALATAIGEEIKDVRAEIALVAGGAIVATSSLDFGSAGCRYKLFTVSDANLTSGNRVTNIVYTPTSNNVLGVVKESIDDDEFDSIEFSIRSSSVGSFQVLARSGGIVNNYKTIQYTIQ